MKNPATVKEPKVKFPVPMGERSKLSSKSKKNKGNLPYLRFRRGMRKDLFRR